MREIVLLTEKQSENVRLSRSLALAELFQPSNEQLLIALTAYLQIREYDALMDMLNNDQERHTARGMHRMASTLIDNIKEEVKMALEKSNKPKDEGKE